MLFIPTGTGVCSIWTLNLDYESIVLQLWHHHGPIFQNFFCYLLRQLDLNPQLRIVSLLFCYCATTMAQYFLKMLLIPTSTDVYLIWTLNLDYESIVLQLCHHHGSIFQNFFCYLSCQLNLKPQLKIMSWLFCHFATTMAQIFFIKNAIYPK